MWEVECKSERGDSLSLSKNFENNIDETKNFNEGEKNNKLSDKDNETVNNV